MQRLFKPFLFSLILVLISSSAYTQRCRQGDNRGPKGLMGIPDLSTEQIQKIEKLRLERQKTVLTLKTKIKSAHLDLQGLIMEGSDQKILDKKIEEIGKMKTELMKKRVAHRMEIRNLLTDEQKVIFDTQKMGCFGGGCEGFGKRGAGRGKGDFQPPNHPRW